MSAQRLKIVERGWAGYSGPFGGVEFKNGLSVGLVDEVTATRLGSIIRLERVDTGDQAGSAANHARAYKVEAPIVTPIPETDGATVQTPVPAAPPAPAYTREELEKIADKDGIAGLRDIAAKFGVKGRGIVELIDEIMAKQVA